VLYSKPDCHLCDVAKKIIAACQQERAFALRVVDISGDAQLLAQYGNDIPVVTLDGKEIARHFIRRDQLLQAVDEAAKTTTFKVAETPPPKIMNKKNLTFLFAGALVGVALSASVLSLRAEDPPDPTMEMLKKIHAQGEKLVEGQEAMKKELAEIKSEVQFIKARSGQ
jgi:glutaredoxin